MRRRNVVELFTLATLLGPRAAAAQSSERIRRIVFLQELEQADPEAQRRIFVFERALANLGWVKGRNIGIDYHWGGGNLDLTRKLAIEAIRFSPDVIVTAGTSVIKVVAPETKSIPIVFVLVSDPVSLGFVASLSRPGGNVTGFSVFEPGIGGKWLQLLKEAAPQVTRLGFLFNPETAPIGESLSLSLAKVAPEFGLSVGATPVHDGAEIESTMVAAAREPGGGFIIAPDTFTYIHRTEIIALAARHRLPVIYPFREFVEIGGLLSYGVDLLAPFGEAPAYVDRILKGERPADLPVQNPTKFSLVVNAKTARALGLSFPTALLARADEVIE